MRRLFTLLALGLGLAVLSIPPAGAQKRTVNANDKYITREVPGIGAFDEIVLYGVADVEFRQTAGPEISVSMHGSKNILDYIEIKNVGRTLEISQSKNITIRGRHKLNIYISAPGVKKAVINGAGDMKFPGEMEASGLTFEIHGTGEIDFDRISCDDLSFLIRGAGDIEGRQAKAKNITIEVFGTGDADINNIEAENVKVFVKGTGDVDINGKATDALLDLRGTGDIDAEGLTADNVTATVAGAGDISCWAVKSLRATMSGIGSIKYKGDPQDIIMTSGRTGGIKRAK